MNKKIIVDIQNKTSVSIDSCEKEPIHIPGSIQPHGYLLAVTTDTHIITHCSANVEKFLHQPLEQVLGSSLETLFSSQYHSITAFLENEQARTNGTLLVEHHNGFGYCHLSVVKSNNLYILEFDQCADLAEDLSAARAGINELLMLVQKPQSIQALCQAMAVYVQNKLEFDRVMIYRFHPDYSGEVIGEAVKEGMEPYLGLRYPAGDIPPQARELYLRNKIRIISNVNYQPVPLFTYVDGDKSPEQLDLSDSFLRSVSPIHIQYLKNMGVTASFSLSIIKDNKLWGLIACHHNTPKHLSPSQRQAALLYGLVLSSQLDVYERAESLQLVAKVDEALDVLLKKLQREGLDVNRIIIDPSLEHISGATGVIALIKGRIYRSGDTPSEEDTLDLLNFLHDHASSGTVVTQKLIDIYPEAEAYADVASGVIYHRLTNSTDDAIAWIKPGLDHVITWAGNPEKPMERDSETHQLQPRTSFAAWKQTVKSESTAWHNHQINATYLFASALQKYLHLAYLKKEEEKQRLLANELKKSNEELDNINWINAHDLKEPLRKIRVFISRMLQSEELPEKIEGDLQKVNKSAMRMQVLLEDIMNYARVAAREQLHNQEANLNEVIREALDNFSEEMESRSAKITVDSMPLVYGNAFQLRQLFTNLIGNALKFTPPDKTPEITVSHAQNPTDEVTEADLTQYFVVNVTDNGVGFEDQYKERIFRLFQRLDNNVHGTGIGLAICRKIMENHQGKIDVSSLPGVGTTFRLYFPIEFIKPATLTN
ncbi:ATP-binding protein [Cytophagaceae bacterium DM2B3-1]|uniref:histidine kinase n=1 Tax=Xanthocytophaga flava TaxID=3048013 RepID=A0ABT7CRW4_9BACT|nr:ATP-binding protein [Xanthocytophaga flavus]MDJ1496489.1 ATP-binding protein [Xanthocytophaga flavus]